MSNTPAHWSTDQERIDLMEFLVEKTKDVQKPLSVQMLSKEFKEKTGSATKLTTICSRVRYVHMNIHNFENLDKNTKVKLLFGLSGYVDGVFLNELRNEALVEVDQLSRITTYIAENGSLHLKGEHSAEVEDGSKVKKEQFVQDEETLPKTDDAELVQFLVEATKNVPAPLNITPLAEQFKEQSKTDRTVDYWSKRIDSIRPNIQKLQEVDTKTKVTLMFALSAPVDEDYMKKLCKDASVEVDVKKRITSYKANDGSLELKGVHSMSTITKTTPAIVHTVPRTSFKKIRKRNTGIAENKRATSQKLCAVCGDVSLKKKHGVQSCGSCAIFFHRRHGKKSEKCSNDGKCVLTPQSRSCIECRFKKCLEVGMKQNKRMTLDGTKCKVCGAESRFTNYGVQSCIRCANFFGRHIDKPKDICRWRATCEITSRSGANCTACRLKKCLDVGMRRTTPLVKLDELPCKVCETLTPHRLYGVQTCNSCKDFFGRQKSKKAPKCQFDGSCEVRRGEGKVCIGCRFKKCVDAGLVENDPSNAHNQTNSIISSTTSVKKETKAEPRSSSIKSPTLKSDTPPKQTHCSLAESFDEFQPKRVKLENHSESHSYSDLINDDENIQEIPVPAQESREPDDDMGEEEELLVPNEELIEVELEYRTEIQPKEVPIKLDQSTSSTPITKNKKSEEADGSGSNSDKGEKEPIDEENVEENFKAPIIQKKNIIKIPTNLIKAIVLNPGDKKRKIREDDLGSSEKKPRIKDEDQVTVSEGMDIDGEARDEGSSEVSPLSSQEVVEASPTPEVTVSRQTEDPLTPAHHEEDQMEFEQHLKLERALPITSTPFNSTPYYGEDFEYLMKTSNISRATPNGLDNFNLDLFNASFSVENGTINQSDYPLYLGNREESIQDRGVADEKAVESRSSQSSSPIGSIILRAHRSLLESIQLLIFHLDLPNFEIIQKNIEETLEKIDEFSAPVEFSEVMKAVDDCISTATRRETPSANKQYRSLHNFLNFIRTSIVPKNLPNFENIVQTLNEKILELAGGDKRISIDRILFSLTPIISIITH